LLAAGPVLKPAAVVARVSPASQGRKFFPEGREKCLQWGPHSPLPSLRIACL